MRSNIVITGAGSGLGRALAVALCSKQHHLILVDVSVGGLNDTASLLTAKRQTFSTENVDLAYTDELPKWFASVEERFTNIDRWFNCAGMTISSSATDMSVQQWQQITSVNLLGCVVLSTLAATHMKANNGGHIVNIASMFGQLPAPSGIGYATTKHGLIGFTRTLAIEMMDSNVHIHLVCPGFIGTKLFENATYNAIDKKSMLPDIQQMMSPEDAANRILNGIERKRQWIIFPLYVRILWWVEWFFPTLMSYVWNAQWKKFVSKRSR